MNFREILGDEARFIKKGKVRDIFEIEDGNILIIASDRISAFDVVFPDEIPGKGVVLNTISSFWFDMFKNEIKNHIIISDFEKFPHYLKKHEELRGRSVIVEKCEIFPIEAIVRGYITGSAWKSYQKAGEICGIELKPGLQESERFPEPLFTPTTKAEEGHDENISLDEFRKVVGEKYADDIINKSIDLYKKANEYANSKGLILADTKLEFGKDKDGNLVLVDEIFTPDSSRYWSLDGYKIGQGQDSFDKQFIRNYVSSVNWDKNPPAPDLPKEIIDKTINLYNIAKQKITGQM